MKIYAIFTPSHRVFYDSYFLRSISKDDNLEVIPTELPQECETGSFYKEGWSQTCFRKVELFIKACEENMGNTFIFSDVDIQFFGPIRNQLLLELGDYDFACQNDTGAYYCSGFWICKANERTLNMFKSMRDNYNKEDQTSLNEQVYLCKSKFLSRKFFTIAHVTGRVWNGEDVYIPDDILMHHANWTEGIDNKIKLLKMVKNKIDGTYTA